MPETKQCPRCDQKFSCQAEAVVNCQCSEVPLTEKQRQQIAQQFSGCLCQTCLLELKQQLQN